MVASAGDDQIGCGLTVELIHVDPCAGAGLVGRVRDRVVAHDLVPMRTGVAVGVISSTWMLAPPPFSARRFRISVLSMRP